VWRAAHLVGSAPLTGRPKGRPMDDRGSFEKGRGSVAHLKQQLRELNGDIEHVQQLIVECHVHGRPSVDVEQALLLLLEARATCEHATDMQLHRHGEGEA